jgi:uncharacterized membrane protein
MIKKKIVTTLALIFLSIFSIFAEPSMEKSSDTSVSGVVVIERLHDAV